MAPPIATEDVRPVLHEYDRVAVLIDNLDKTWEKGVDFETLSHFLLSLLVTSGRLQAEFDKAPKAAAKANVTLTVFLRTDIFDVMTQFAREPDKINPQTIQWQDEELLIRVLEERSAANRLGGVRQLEGEALWSEVFCPEVHGLPTRDYFLWRALPRPRDIIFLGNSALATTAINRRHKRFFPRTSTWPRRPIRGLRWRPFSWKVRRRDSIWKSFLFEFAGFWTPLYPPPSWKRRRVPPRVPRRLLTGSSEQASWDWRRATAVSCMLRETPERERS